MMTLSNTYIEGRDQLVRDSVPYSMTSLSSLTICVRSVNDAICLLTTADAATVKIITMLGRMRELAAQACRETCSALDRASLIQEYESLVVEMDHIAATTEWNGVKILYGCTETINLFPAESPDSSLGDVDAFDININTQWSAFGVAAGGGTPLTFKSFDLSSKTDATAALSGLVEALDGAVAEQERYGAYLSKLKGAADNLANVSTNTLTALSLKLDNGYAKAITNFARSQIISQASTAMLAQANQSKQTVLALLR